jgi:uncharacterized protein YfiM (DUF2279 family)
MRTWDFEINGTGMGIAFALGRSKEIADTRKPGGRTGWKDLAADAAGIAAGFLLLARW